MDILTIERLGGLAGIGSLGSRMKSQGQVALASLCAEDQTAVEQLFTGRAKKRPTAVADGFCYRISRTVKTGVETIVVTEEAVPQSLIRCVKDELT